jgi:hypothetical protein
VDTSQFGWNYAAGGATPASSGRKRANPAANAGDGVAGGPITPTKGKLILPPQLSNISSLLSCLSHGKSHSSQTAH